MSSVQNFPKGLSLLNDLEETQSRFLSLLDRLPDDAFDQSSPGAGWTLKEEMVHIVQVLELMPAGIERAVKGGGRSLLAVVPPGFRGWVNGHILIPLKARHATRGTIAAAYREAHKTLVSLLGNLNDADWEQGMPFPREYRTVLQMAYRPVEHFEEHEAHIRACLDRVGSSSL